MKKKITIFFTIILLLLLFGAAGLLFGKLQVEAFWRERGHGMGYAMEETYEESARKLDNPNRGFYHLEAFYIRDTLADYPGDMGWCFEEDDTVLSLVEINLRNYAGGEISEGAMINLENLFAALETTNRNYIVRFLYDWDGQNAQIEPENVELILHHMEQVADTVNKRKDRIFLIQGLFIGNWGEMNGTKYTDEESLRALSGKLSGVVDDEIYLSVRTPSFWRIITGNPGQSPLASRLGLYNDGMLGSVTDVGTYNENSSRADGYERQWNRKEELEFQSELCRTVPNGGEAILNNEYNDFDNAIRDMRTMRISYLNLDYDESVLGKWRDTTVSEAGCYDGMSGLDYIERHLGYRLLIDGTKIEYDFDRDILSVDVLMRNVGFAPIYREAGSVLTVLDENGEERYRAVFDQDIRQAAGGDDLEEQEIFHLEIPMQGWEEASYRIFFRVTDQSSDRQIAFAHEDEPGEYGYQVGTLELESAQDYLDRWLDEHGLGFIPWKLEP